MELSKLTTSSILILGFGREGQDAFVFLKKAFPDKTTAIADIKSQEEFSQEAQELLSSTTTHLGNSYTDSISKYDVIVKAPGIPLHTIQPYLSDNQKITSSTAIFFANCPSTIIGITGTKGKSTVASLIYQVLQKGDRPVHLVGNIGIPSLQALSNATPQDIFVYELSSFQLEGMTQSPHIAVFLNLYQEHLNHHQTFKAYKQAKANIALHQTAKDILIYNKEDAELKDIAAATKAELIPYAQTSAHSFIAPTEPASIIGKLFDIPEETINQAVSEFKPLAHRLENIGEYKGITFYNDSLATIPEATIAALKSLGGNTHTLIAGGFDRGVDYSELAAYIEGSSIQTLIAFPDTGKKIVDLLDGKRMIQSMFVDTMQDAVQKAYEHTPQGSICLLSPAASSFNLFLDYADRGDKFKEEVMRHGK
ncbi:MAG: UDP-N-acetylmuramoyl-L-alanine--D-glutamate ligase [archaeon]|nr:UDP-N-acetylmuramoyl-L-alanine--D-glutamate ligase [archaeon]